jgi:hypothetical protein
MSEDDHDEGKMIAGLVTLTIGLVAFIWIIM